VKHNKLRQSCFTFPQLTRRVSHVVFFLFTFSFAFLFALFFAFFFAFSFAYSNSTSFLPFVIEWSINHNKTRRSILNKSHRPSFTHSANTSPSWLHFASIIDLLSDEFSLLQLSGKWHPS